MANLKTGVTRKQSMQNLPKNEHFLPPDTNFNDKFYNPMLSYLSC